MKKLIILLLACLMMTGCDSNKDGSLAMIEETKAIKYALENLQVEEKDVTDLSIRLIQNEELKYYQIGFNYQYSAYSYQIDGYTGKVIGFNSFDNGYQKALSVALNDCDLAEDQVWYFKEECGLINHQYHVKFCHHYLKEFLEYSNIYHYIIDSNSFEIIDCMIEDECNWHPTVQFGYSEEIPSNSLTDSIQQTNILDENEIKQIALAQVPGATLNNITKLAKMDPQDQGYMIYEGIIVYENIEFTFEIDGYTGEIITWKWQYHS